jgi:hypothetical protein
MARQIVYSARRDNTLMRWRSFSFLKDNPQEDNPSPFVGEASAGLFVYPLGTAGGHE